jgi:hypothetical protein
MFAEEFASFEEEEEERKIEEETFNPRMIEHSAQPRKGE